MRVRTSTVSILIVLATLAATGAAQGQRSAEVCRRWAADRVDRSEGTWTGNADMCVPGDVTEPGRTNALKILNLYRFLAEMPEVTTDPARNQKAQECALMQSVNGGLSHTPPNTWKCYTAGGAEASGKSNLSGGKGVSAMDAYMTDRNVAQMGHRRWVLANSLGPVGLGSATASCFWNLDGTGKAGKSFVAWPPVGPVPFDVFRVNSLDTAGWTIQSDSINLPTTVTVSDAGQDRPVTVTVLPANYGSRYAIKIVPNGWTSQAGHTYAVSVQGTTMPIAYSVEVVDCANVDGGAGGAGGAGGSGGADAGTAGRGGGAGAGATGGAAGSGATGGAAGSGATGGAGGSGATGGAGGSGATGGTTGGAGGSSATGGSGGTAATGGTTTGTGATGGATTGSGGSTGGGTSGGSGGSGNAGGASGGAGGASGSSGSDPGSSGRSPSGGVEQVGCACTTPGRVTNRWPAGLGVVLAMVIGVGARRQRTSKSTQPRRLRVPRG